MDPADLVSAEAARLEEELGDRARCFLAFRGAGRLTVLGTFTQRSLAQKRCRDRAEKDGNDTPFKWLRVQTGTDSPTWCTQEFSVGTKEVHRYYVCELIIWDEVRPA